MLALRCEELVFQLTAYIGILPVSAWPSHDGKEGGNVKSQELILCKYKICVVSMKIVIGHCYVNFFTGLLCAEN